MKTRRWLKVECSPSDTPPILLPRHLPPSLSFAANSLRSHMPLCDSMAGTGLPADVRRCSEWICFPPSASCFLQTQKPLPRPSFEGRDRVWRSAGELQLRVFCIYKRPAALRSKKSAAALQHFYFLLGMMCHGRGVFQPGVFCVCRRPAAWKVPGKLRWNWMPPVRA